MIIDITENEIKKSEPSKRIKIYEHYISQILLESLVLHSIFRSTHLSDYFLVLHGKELYQNNCSFLPWSIVTFGYTHKNQVHILFAYDHSILSSKQSLRYNVYDECCHIFAFCHLNNTSIISPYFMGTHAHLPALYLVANGVLLSLLSSTDALGHRVNVYERSLTLHCPQRPVMGAWDRAK